MTMPLSATRTRTARSVAVLRAAVSGWRAAGETIGLVPTMGALHAGHLALIDAVRRAGADRVVVSIFVNPRQFNRPDDLARYPRTEAADLRRLEEASVDLAFLPAVAAMYPEGFATTLSVGGPIVRDLEGAFRPGHFDGVATVVSKLLLQAAPDLAAFGEKDYQQLLLVRRLVRDLDMACRIVAVPTVRDEHGLALSSRNALLSPDQLGPARQLNRVLREVARGVLTPEDGAGALSNAGFGPVDYLVIRDAETLQEPRTGHSRRVLAAASLGTVRLIDNLPA